MTDWTADDLHIRADEFLTTLLGETRERPDETVVMGRKLADREDATGKTKRGGFIPGRWPETLAKSKHHVSIGLQRRDDQGPGGKGGQSSRNVNWTGMWALVLDDVIEKVREPDVDPTCIIETKPGSQQWWYVFKSPVRNLFLAEQLIDGAIAAGLSDPGMSNVVRWARLPGSQPPGKQFAARVVEWSPDLRFEPEALAKALGLELKSWDHWNGETSGFDVSEMGAAVDDPLLAWMDSHGLVSGRSGREWLEMECPRYEEHSDQDALFAYYLPQREQGGGLFKCFHGHDGHPPSQDEFIDHLRGCGCPDELLKGAGGTQVRDLSVLAGLMGKAPRKLSKLEQRRRARLIASGQEDDVPVDPEPVSAAAAAVMAGNVMPKVFDTDLRPDVDLLDFVHVLGEDVYVNRHTGEKLKRTAFDYAMANLLDLRKPDNKPEKAAEAFVRAMGDIAYGIRYRPDIEGHLFREGRKVYLNSYHFEPLPEPYHDPEAVRVLNRHLQMLFPDHWEYLRTWMAYVVQNPGVKVKSAILLVGRQGDGKSSIGEMVRAALGKEPHSGLVRGSSVNSRFNTSLTGKVFVALEEIRVVGEGGRTDRNSLYDIMKELITGTAAEVEAKGKDAYSSSHHCTNYLGTTNFANGMDIPTDDRRWSVLQTVFFAHSHDEMPPPSREYWDNLNEYITNPDGFGAVRQWLLDVDTSAFNPSAEALMTDAKRDMMTVSKPTLQQEVEDLLEEGRIGIWPDAISSVLMTQAMENDDQRKPSSRALGMVMADMGFTLCDIRPRIAGKQHRLYYRRKAFLGRTQTQIAEAIKQRIETGASADADLLTRSNVVDLKPKN